MYLQRLQATTPQGYPYGDILAICNGNVTIDSNHCLQGDERITLKLLPEAFTQPKIEPRLQILHTQASSGRASNENAWNFARNYSNNDAHIYGPDMVTGRIIQAMPFNVRADSNYHANEFDLNGHHYGALSMETQDNGAATLDTTEWTLAQLGTIVAVLTACCFTYRMSCAAVGHPYDSGISQHNAFRTEWSLSAHSCPGAARTRQMDWIRSEVAKRLAVIYPLVGETCPT